MPTKKPTPALNAGAEAERRAVRTKIRKMLNAMDAAEDDNAVLECLLEWINKRSARTAKRVGGLGRR